MSKFAFQPVAAADVTAKLEAHDRRFDELEDELEQTRERAERAEQVAHTAIQQLRENGEFHEDSFSRFSVLMKRLDSVEEDVENGDGGDVAPDQQVDRSEFLSVHRAYMDVRDGVERDLESNERRAARLFKDVLERGDTSFGKLKYDSGDARRFLESVDDMTHGGKAKTVTRALRTLAIMSKNPATGERLFEFKQPSKHDVRCVKVVADVDDVKAYLNRVDNLLDDVATSRYDDAEDDPAEVVDDDDTDETDETVVERDETAAEFDALDAATPGDNLSSSVEQRDVSRREAVADAAVRSD